MRIAVIGTGNVGGALGKRWAQGGHTVVFASRDPGSAKVQQLLRDAGANASAADPREACGGSEVVVLATPWDGTQQAIRSAGPLSGKVLIDCTNPLTADFSALVVGHTTSGGEQVAQWAPGARVVKAFHSTGAGNLANPSYGGRPITMLLCGDDAGAKGVVSGLARDLGFDPVDAGPLLMARLTEPFALMWIALAYARGLGPEFAFTLVKR